MGSRTATSGRTRTSRNQKSDDDGRAMIEVIFLAVLVLIPIVYLLASVLRVQSATFAVAQAARDIGRLIETAPDPGTAAARIDQSAAIAAQALIDQRVPADQPIIRFVNSGTDCRRATGTSPTIAAGAQYDVCVIAIVHLPGIPTVLSGSANTVTGVYTVHIGEFREGS